MHILWRYGLKLGALFSLLVLTAFVAQSEGGLVDVGDHRLYLDCSGRGSGPTVVLEAGAGGGSADWTKVQRLVEQSWRVCSYDRAGLGRSDKALVPSTANSVVADLHALLANTRQPGPYLLVGHSLGGLYVRTFASRYPTLVKGIVLVDSSHEEQLNRYTAISPEIGRQFALQQGRSSYESAYTLWGQLRPGEKLTWHVDVPIIVIEHHRPGLSAANPSNEADQVGNKIADAWHDMQVDLTHRSSKGQLREAKGGHMIPREEPEVVAQAVTDLLNGQK